MMTAASGLRRMPPLRRSRSTRPTTLPSTEPGDLEDLSRFVASDDAGIRKSAAVVCLVGSPGKMAVFRTSKDMSLYRDVFILELEADDEKKTQYLVDASLCELPEFAGRVKRKKLVPYITTQEVIGLWPISVDFADNSWVKSATSIILEAQDRWVSAISHKAGGQYRILPAETDHGEPEWPEMTFMQWLGMAFPRDRRIMNREHPVAKKLRG